MEKAVTKESFMTVMEIIKRITDEIRRLKPRAEAILKSMSEEEFKRKVCNHTFEMDDAEVSFECAYHNEMYFDALNRGTGKKVDKPGVNVWFKERVKFIVDCPFAGTDICKLRNFTYPKENDFNEEVKDL